MPDATKYEGKLWNNFISLKFGITVSDDLVHNLYARMKIEEYKKDIHDLTNQVGVIFKE